MKSLQQTKLELLSYSKNMVNYAQSQDWESLARLDQAWQVKLQAAVEGFGGKLDTIGQQLIADNQQIQSCIASAQQELAEELHQSTRGTSKLKKYLK